MQLQDSHPMATLNEYTFICFKEKLFENGYSWHVCLGFDGVHQSIHRIVVAFTSNGKFDQYASVIE